jgi:putative spermidine/putrescine transport system substrate-binding protein
MFAALSRRVRPIAAAALLALIVSGCGPAAGPSAPVRSAASAGTGAPSATPALESELVVLGFSGAQQTVLEQQINPAFEKATGVKVTASYATAAANAAKVQSGLSADVVWVNEYDAEAARAQGRTVCLDRAAVPNLKDVYPVIVGPTDCYVSVGFQATVLLYNKDVFKKNSWDAPKAWADLTDPKFKGRVVGMDISNGYGMAALLEWAKIESGTKPLGFDGAPSSAPKVDDYAYKYAQKVKANAITFCVDLACNENLFSSGQAYIGYTGHGRAGSLIASGAPLGIVYPKEGTMVLGVTTFISKTGKSPRAAMAYLNFLLSPEIQGVLAKANRFAPANQTVKLGADLVDVIPDAAAIKSFDRGDWQVVNASRSKWQERWNSEIAK